MKGWLSAGAGGHGDDPVLAGVGRQPAGAVAEGRRVPGGAGADHRAGGATLPEEKTESGLDAENRPKSDKIVKIQTKVWHE